MMVTMTVPVATLMAAQSEAMPDAGSSPEAQRR
jgi:hypothetical protein